MSKWKTLESAPEDTFVLIVDHLGDMYVAHNQFGYWYAWGDYINEELEIKTARYWRYLPSPPEELDE